MRLNDGTRVLGFLFDLACRAPHERLVATWLGMRDEGRLPELRRAAGRHGLTSALGAFAELLPPDALDGDARQAVAAAMRAQHAVASVGGFLARLCAAPGLAGREVVVVKGLALLLDGRYERERDFCDADVLVREADLPAWQAAAARLGATYEACVGEAHEFASIRGSDGLVELHAALPANVAFERGPGFDAVRAHARPPRRTGAPPNVLVVADGAAQEIAVHHFVYHHSAQPMYALRTLQDLRTVGLAPAGADLLPWGDPSPRGAVARLHALACTYAAPSADAESARAAFLERLAAVDALPATGDVAFADSVRRWSTLRTPDGPTPLRRVASRLVPPRPPGAPRPPLPALAFGTVRRLFSLSARTLRGLRIARRERVSFRLLDSWRSYLSS